MALRERFREELYDSERKTRLNYARNYFLKFSVDKDIDFRELERFYNEWRDFIEYIVLQKQSDSLKVNGEIERETFAIKCATRGNDVYWWRIQKRLRFLKELKDGCLFDPHKKL